MKEEISPEERILIYTRFIESLNFFFPHDVTFEDLFTRKNILENIRFLANIGTRRDFVLHMKKPAASINNGHTDFRDEKYEFSNALPFYARPLSDDRWCIVRSQDDSLFPLGSIIKTVN